MCNEQSTGFYQSNISVDISLLADPTSYALIELKKNKKIKISWSEGHLP